MVEVRLREVAEAVLGESECGYRKNRGGADATFLLRRMLEEFRSSLPKGQREQAKDLYVLFVDLKKAFDSVDRELLWKLLRDKFGIPEDIVKLLRLLHDGMQVILPMRTGQQK